MAVYYATKAYMLSFSLALSIELDGTGVSVTCLAPGPVRTPFRRARGSRLRGSSAASGEGEPADVARVGWAALERGRRLVIPGVWNRIGASRCRSCRCRSPRGPWPCSSRPSASEPDRESV